jgi:hypothetical protein
MKDRCYPPPSVAADCTLLHAAMQVGKGITWEFLQSLQIMLTARWL